MRNPRPSGLLGTKPRPNLRRVGRSTSSGSRTYGEYSVCKAAIGCTVWAWMIASGAASQVEESYPSLVCGGGLRHDVAKDRYAEVVGRIGPGPWPERASTARGLTDGSGPVMVRSGPTSTKCHPHGMHLRPGTRIREDKAVTERSTQVDEGNPLPEPPQLPPAPAPEPETSPRSHVEELREEAAEAA